MQPWYKSGLGWFKFELFFHDQGQRGVGRDTFGCSPYPARYAAQGREGSPQQQWSTLVPYDAVCAEQDLCKLLVEAQKCWPSYALTQCPKSHAVHLYPLKLSVGPPLVNLDFSGIIQGFTKMLDELRASKTECPDFLLMNQEPPPEGWYVKPDATAKEKTCTHDACIRCRKGIEQSGSSKTKEVPTNRNFGPGRRYGYGTRKQLSIVLNYILKTIYSHNHLLNALLHFLCCAC